MQSQLFDSLVEQGYKPLADRLRPTQFDHVVGQGHLVGGEGYITRALTKGYVPSVILWGPPGCGKTTIAKLMAVESGYYFDIVSAVSSGTQELRQLFQQARVYKEQGKGTVLLVDEIHRFNRAQQDVFLPYIEDGTIVLVGATTENPSFELNAALLSRAKVLVLKRLDEEALMQLLARAEAFENTSLPITLEARVMLVGMADGDGRYLLGLAEELFAMDVEEAIVAEQLVEVLQKRMPMYDKSRDEHYNLISALHKSLRGSDVDAALYWFARMLAGGENPLYVVRRLVRFAVEDIGLADPEAVHQALAAKEAYDFLGSPEGELAIAQAVIYLAMAPKSNAAYMAYKSVVRSAKQHGSLMPPKHVLNAPTGMMKDQGYGKGYEYDHDVVDGFSGQNYFPETMVRESYYTPKERGFERELMKRLQYFQKLREKKSC